MVLSLVWAFETPKPTPLVHITSNKATPPNAPVTSSKLGTKHANEPMGSFSFKLQQVC